MKNYGWAEEEWKTRGQKVEGGGRKAKRDSSHAQADPFAAANGKEKVGLLRSE